MNKPFKYGLALIDRKFDELRQAQKAGKAPPDVGLSLSPRNPIIVRSNATKTALMDAFPLILETYGIMEPDLDTLKGTLKMRRKQREEEKKQHAIEAEKSWAIQREPIYRFGLMLSYAPTSTTHKTLKQEIARLPTKTKRGLLKAVLDGQRTSSFTAVPSETIERGISWLSNLINAEA